MLSDGSTCAVVAIGATRTQTLLVLASSDTISNAFVAQIYAFQRGSAISTLCMHTHKGTSTQRSDGGEYSQEGLHGEETINGWK